MIGADRIQTRARRDVVVQEAEPLDGWAADVGGQR